MSSINRYIPIKAIKTSDNELIPFWDKSISYREDEDCGRGANIKGHYHSYYNFVDCVYDTETGKVEGGIYIDYYPDANHLEFKKGQDVFFEKKHRVLGESKIKEIVYEEFELSIHKGKDISEYYQKTYVNINFESETLYAFKQWKPFYLLDNGVLIKWTHQLYHKENK